MLKTPTNFSNFLRGRRAVYRVVMETPMWRRLAGSEMSVSLTVSGPCSYHGSPSSHSCAPPLEVFPARGGKSELEEGLRVWGGDAALTHTISYLQSPGVGVHFAVSKFGLQSVIGGALTADISIFTHSEKIVWKIRTQYFVYQYSTKTSIIHSDTTACHYLS